MICTNNVKISDKSSFLLIIRHAWFKGTCTKNNLNTVSAIKSKQIRGIKISI